MNGKLAREDDGSEGAGVYRADGGLEYMAGTGYSNQFTSDKSDLPDEERLWWCPSCGAVFDRHHRERDYKFCNNCESRDAVLIECEPVGPGAEEVGQ